MEKARACPGRAMQRFSEAMSRIFALWFAGRGIILAALFAALITPRYFSAAPVKPVWLLLVLVAVVLRLWSGAHIGSHSNGAVLEVSPRAASGPYRFLRHPLYLSNLLAATGLIGFAHCLSALWAVLLGLSVAGHHAILIRGEERILTRAERQIETTAPAGFRGVWRRQGRNVAYALMAAAALWGAARWR